MTNTGKRIADDRFCASTKAHPDEPRGRSRRRPHHEPRFDRCALSLPIEPPDTVPVGLMVVGRHGEDCRLLAIGIGIEDKLTTEAARDALCHCEDPRTAALRGFPGDEAISLV